MRRFLLIGTSLMLALTTVIFPLSAKTYAEGTSFSGPVESPVGRLSMSIAKGDFNGDSHLDIVAANRGDTFLTVLYGDGTGQLGSRQDLAIMTPAVDVNVADINGDNKLDIIAIAGSQAGFTLFGDGTGNFSAPVTFYGQEFMYSVEVDDMNNDGDADLIIATQNLGGLVLFGDGTGAFPTRTTILPVAPQPADTDVRPWDAATKDFNNDGNVDIVSANYTSTDHNSSASIVLGDGNGGFSAPIPLAEGLNNNYSLKIEAGNLNNDGNADFVLSASNGLYAFLGNGDGTFSASLVGTDYGGGDTSLELADYNSDGTQDIVFASTGLDWITLLAGDGTGEFVLENKLTSSSSPRAPQVGDFNEDGRPDIAVVSLPSEDPIDSPSSVHVHTNIGSQAIISTINNIGTNPLPTNTQINPTANFTDSDSLDTHTAVWDWGDGTSSAGTVIEVSGVGSVSGNHAYTASGVYTVTLTVTDSNGAISTRTHQFVTVYNPTPQGLFSAGQRYTSPPTTTPFAYRGANVKFGLSYKYQGTVPVDKKQFTLDIPSADFSFNATSVSLLSISNGVATLRGSGTVNGAGTYTYLVVGDEANNTIRIQIKDQAGAVVYDTQNRAPDSAAPSTPVTGNVLVH